MARNKGGIVLVNNYQVKLEGALDPRVAVATAAELIVRDTWPNDGGDPYLYDGLLVSVLDEKAVYMLVDKKKALSEDYSGWERIDAGGVQIDNIFTYKGNVDTFEALPTNANVGDVYNVNSDFTITINPELGSGEEAIVKTYLAGTNVAWNGSDWDPLAGAIDLSLYVTKSEISTIIADVESNAANINKLSEDLGKTNEEVAKKVDAVEGSSLITAEKLALIDTNASEIQALEDLNLDNRLKVVESAFTGEGGTIDLGDITSAITAHGERISTLESDSATKAELSELQTQVNGHGGRLTAIETLNTDQGTQISSLTTRVEAVEAHGTAITNLTNTVNGHTQKLSNIESSINGLSLGYDSENKKLQLKDINSNVINDIDASPFIKDGMLSDASYDKDAKKLVLTWNADAGKTATEIAVGDLVDTYTAGGGLVVSNNEFSLNLASDNNLLVVEDGKAIVKKDAVRAIVQDELNWVNID